MGRHRGILIPLANPRTAADLVRIGAALMEQAARSPRCPSSRCPKAWRSPRGRRAPARRGACCSASSSSRRRASTAHARAHRPPRGRRHRRGRHRGGSRPDHLRLGRPAPGRAEGRADATRRGLQPDDRRGRARRALRHRVVKQRGVAMSAGSWRRCAVGRTPSWRCASPTRWAAPSTLGRRPPRRPAGLNPVVRSQAERALAAFVRQHAGEPPSRCSSRATTSRTRSSHEADDCAARGDGRHRPRGRTVAAPGERPLRRAARGDRPAGQPHGDRGQDARAPSPHDFDQRAAQAETLEAADRAADCGRASRPASTAGSPSRTSITRSSATWAGWSR